MNAVTVGAHHEDYIKSAPNMGASYDPLPYGKLPTIVSRMGLGFRRSTKPEILTVKSWLYGQRVPKYLDQKIISETLGVNIDILFPES